MDPDGGNKLAPALTHAQLDALRPHVVELQDGALATTALLNTTAADVDAIFTTHLPAFIQARGGGPVPVMFWAHGGLVGEGHALETARQLLPWWLANGIYPVYFIWHTGLWATLGDLVASHVTGTSAAQARPAGAWTDSTDTVIEDAVRALGGPAVWEAMKENARLASIAGGGAALVAQRLQAFLAAKPGALTLHAAGHSAGAQFHSRFIPAVVRPGPGFDSCSLLAPALTTGEYKATLRPLVGAGIASTAVFGMKEAVARADNCFGLYRKSLLYLVGGALEPHPGTPILGLQQSLLADTELRLLFSGSHRAAAVWSIADTGPLRSRSSATSHAAFQHDAPTMDSVVRRITGRDNIISFGAASHPGVLSAAARMAR
ncbi:hypothetical protein [Arthrobacter sp. A2-55]|uniref:hypothetical protein n=1 Tax=Arthrobacter sp. A2-55 TaxID=2897337 RepID=UPI0021CD60A0|nr:hypothetical protein [Arthrobacter sp. A2-55]MCU6479950.1 hypothetical protein [Arthrobacter sp. A2-55]